MVVPLNPILKSDTTDTCNYMLQDNGHMYRVMSGVKYIAGDRSNQQVPTLKAVGSGMPKILHS